MIDFTVVHLILAIAKQRKCLVHFVDYENAFVQGDLKRRVYMRVQKMLDGMFTGKICLLLRSFYGPREALRIWYELLSNELLDIGLKTIDGAPCVFTADGAFILIYVENLFLMAKSQEKLNEVKSSLWRKFRARDLGEANELLCMKLVHGNDAVNFVQSKYVYALIENM